jgi:hypothetical protein
MQLSYGEVHKIKMGNFEMLELSASAEGDTKSGDTIGVLQDFVRDLLAPAMEKAHLMTACGPGSPEGDSYIHEWQETN